MEIAKLQDGQLVYGEYEEVEKYAEKQDTCVEHYFDHVNPSTVYKNFKYVGKAISNPYAVSVPFNYTDAKPNGTFDTAGRNKDKW